MLLRQWCKNTTGSIWVRLLHQYFGIPLIQSQVPGSKSYTLDTRIHPIESNMVSDANPSFSVLQYPNLSSNRR